MRHRAGEMAHRYQRDKAGHHPPAQVSALDWDYAPAESDQKMAIEQPQPPEPSLPSQAIATSLDPQQDLEYPYAPTPERTSGPVMPLILWSLSLLLGILIFVVHLPLNAPRIDQLTMYTCDPLPPLPSLGSRQSYPLNLRCRAGDQGIYQRTNTIPYSYQATTIPCIKQIGPTRIWRTSPPSPYGSYVFQVTCGDLIITNYKTRAAIYETTQRFVIAFGTLFTLLSVIGLTISLVRFRRRIRMADGRDTARSL
jgi:hypothetical protein